MAIQSFLVALAGLLTSVAASEASPAVGMGDASVQTVENLLWLHGPSGIQFTTGDGGEAINLDDLCLNARLEESSERLDGEIATLGGRLGDVASEGAEQRAQLQKAIQQLSTYSKATDDTHQKAIDSLEGLLSDEKESRAASDAALSKRLDDTGAEGRVKRAELRSMLQQLSAQSQASGAQNQIAIQALDSALKLELSTRAAEDSDLSKRIGALNDVVSGLSTTVTQLTSSFSRLDALAKCNFNGELKAGKCVCEPGWLGSDCSVAVAPATCKDGYATGRIRSNGQATVHRNNLNVPVYCMNGGNAFGSGWELVFNLDPTDDVARSYTDAFWTSPGQVNAGNVGNPFQGDFKGHGWSNNKDFSEVLIVTHNGDGKATGWATYTMSVTGLSWHQLVVGGTRTVTGSRTKQGGGVKSSLQHNSARPQPLYGDIFVDNYNNGLVVNKRSGWCAGRNYNRIATTLTNCNYGHTFAGMGGHHEHGVGSWITHYEMAPISPYCSLRRGYGNPKNYKRGDAFSSGCITDNGAVFKWVNVKYSLYVR